MNKAHADGIERKAFIFNIQKYNMYDGPGVRTIIFFKGCPLRCKWCSNPEGLERKIQIMLKKDLCTNCGRCVPVCPLGIHKLDGADREHVVDRSIDCIGCGACVEACMVNALTVAGEQKLISELLDIVEEDRSFYEMSGGGVTLGGGESMSQPEAATSLLAACKQRGINTAIETCGYANQNALLKAAECIDLFLFDIKQMDPQRHIDLTGARNGIILENLEKLLHRRCNVKIRMPLLKGHNDGEEEIDMVIKFLLPYRDCRNLVGIDLLPYHKLGVHKYKQLDMVYPIDGDPSLSDEDLARIEGWFKAYDFKVSVIRH